MEEFKGAINDDELAAEPAPNYTSINKRYLNFLIDTFIVLFSFIFVLYLLIFIFKFTPGLNYLAISLLIYYFLYYFLFEFLSAKTPGKYFTATKVTDQKNGSPSLLQVFIRSIARFIPPDIFSYLLSSYPRGIHDLLSRTVTTDLSYSKIRKANPLKNLALIVLETILFIFISVSVLLVFRFIVFNLLPDLQLVKKIPALINQEISNLAGSQTRSTYLRDTDYGINLVYPDNWVKVGSFEDPNQPAVLLIRSKKALIKITKPARIRTSADLGMKRAKEYLDISNSGEIASQDKLVMNKRLFYRFITKERSDGMNLTLMTIINFSNDLVYVFTFAGYEDEYEKYRQDADAIFKTITIR